MARSTKPSYTLPRELRQVVKRAIAVIGLHALFAGCGESRECTLKGCRGPEVSVELVDDAAKPVAARGELAYSSHSTKAFDCTRSPDPSRNDFGCQDGVITLDSVYNPDDTIEVRFELEDGTFTDWQSVDLSIEKEVLSDFNGPGCDCTVYHGTAEPVVVPAAAR
jgi:hypothetical protein